MRDWPLWTLRRPALAYWLAVEGCALCVVGYALARTAVPTAADLGRFFAIAGTAGAVVIGSALHATRSGEAQRNPWATHVCYLAAGGLALPVNLLALLLLGPALHGVLAPGPAPHRWVFTLSGTALAAFAGRAAIGWHTPSRDLLSLVLAAAVLLLVRAGLIAVGLRLRNPDGGLEDNLGEPTDAVLGVVATAIGGLMGLVLLVNPVQALIAAPPMALLERAAQVPQWRRSAQRDAKTGLANAVYWDTRARFELNRARPRHQPMAVLLLDLDHFKRVNDRIGHLAGDAVLAAVGVVLRGAVRRGDLVGRFGGEEFVVLLADTAPDEAEQVAQRVRRAVAALRVPTTGADSRQHVLSDLTVSIGVAVTERFGYDLGALLGAADSALLSAKGYGRNLVEMA